MWSSSALNIKPAERRKISNTSCCRSPSVLKLYSQWLGNIMSPSKPTQSWEWGVMEAPVGTGSTVRPLRGHLGKAVKSLKRADRCLRDGQSHFNDTMGQKTTSVHNCELNLNQILNLNQKTLTEWCLKCSFFHWDDFTEHVGGVKTPPTAESFRPDAGLHSLLSSHNWQFNQNWSNWLVVAERGRTCAICCDGSPSPCSDMCRHYRLRFFFLQREINLNSSV